jgi:hypothetical protein
MKVNGGAQEAEFSENTLQKLLHSFERYYNVREEGVSAPFCAEAEFHSHSEQYFLVKAAHVADIDSSEYVFFSETDELNETLFTQLSTRAWEEGLSRIHPYSGHRNSDVTLIILTPKITDAAVAQIKKAKKSKSYKFSFWGWSNFRTLACEVSSGRIVTNRLGKDLKKLVSSL